MAVTKRTRYEVLKRDNFTCRYCRSTEQALKVDHVTPVALGGSDDPSNLVAACQDCNAGKASTSPTEAMVSQVSEDDLRWAAAIKRAAAASAIQDAKDRERHNWFLNEWWGWDKRGDCLPSGWEKSLDRWISSGLTKASLIDCLNIALANRGVRHDAVFAYMGGIARKKIEKLHEDARALLDAEEAVSGA